MRLLVCGDRNWTNRQLMYEVLNRNKDQIEILIQGGARGADAIAEQWARLHSIPCLTFPANWKKHGNAAGPIRNTQMLKEGKPTDVLAFHDDIDNSKGTKNMVEQARKAGVRVTIIGGAVI